MEQPHISSQQSILMQPQLLTFIQNTERQFHLKCNAAYFSQLPNPDTSLLLPKLLSTPMRMWTLDNFTIQKIVQTNSIETNTMLQIQTGLNISEPGSVSICKPNSTIKLFLTDGQQLVQQQSHSMKVLMIKGCSMDLKDNIGRKIIIKSGNIIKYGVMILKNYQIMEQAGKMEQEIDLQEELQNQFQGLQDLIL